MLKKNLIIVRAGKNSLHPGWIAGTNPNFDLWVAAYDQAAVKADTEGVIYKFIPGSKVEGWSVLFEEYGEFIGNYERVALIDDDIEMSTPTANRCFEIGARHNLGIWQPSLSSKSHLTYAASLANGLFKLRFCNHVEMMCAFFKTSILMDVSPLFSLGFESGIDLIWCTMAKEAGGRCAVLDECVVTHTQPVGGQKHLNGFINREYEDDISACLGIFDMKWPSWVVDEAILKNGQVVSNGILLALAALSPLIKVYAAPRNSRRYRIKAALDHIRHQMLRKPYYGKGVREKLARACLQNQRMKSTKQTSAAG